MITKESIEKEVKYISDETFALSTSQPFFDGQLKMNGEIANYSTSVTVREGYDLYGYFNFRNQSKIIPFCRIIPLFYVNGVMQDATTLNLVHAYRSKVLYAQSNQVSWEFRVEHALANGTTLVIKPYIITNDELENYNVEGRWTVVS